MTSHHSEEFKMPESWEPKFFIHVIGFDKPILITEDQRKGIVGVIESGKKFVQIGQFTIMVNSIKMIILRYPPENIPPVPQIEYKGEIKNNLWVQEPIPESVELQKKWRELYGEKHDQLLLEGGTYGTEE